MTSFHRGWFPGSILIILVVGGVHGDRSWKHVLMIETPSEKYRHHHHRHCHPVRPTPPADRQL